jgi:membrane protease YdiL (CAAX protease family)
MLPWHDFALWAPVVSTVALAEEILLRGLMFDVLQRSAGPIAAALVAAIAFALLHVPLYGPQALPVDLAVGLWLGALRLLAGSVAAPATAHVLADLAGWWLI